MKMKLLKVALILSLLLFGAQLPTVEASTLDGETTVNLNVRSTASTTGTLITTLPKGTKVKYGTHNQSWHKVYLNNRTYYASAQYIKPLAPAPITTQAASSTGVTTENLNIRVTSHRDAQIVTTLRKGTEVQYAAHNTSWVKVFLNGKTYYAAKAYIAPKVVTATPQKQTGYTNRTIELFNRTLQTSPVVKTIPANRTVTFSIHNSSWSVIYEGTSTFYTPTRGITAGTLQPSVTKENGYANREMKLFETRNQAFQSTHRSYRVNTTRAGRSSMTGTPRTTHRRHGSHLVRHRFNHPRRRRLNRQKCKVMQTAMPTCSVRRIRAHRYNSSCRNIRL